MSTLAHARRGLAKGLQDLSMNQRLLMWTFGTVFSMNVLSVVTSWGRWTTVMALLSVYALRTVGCLLVLTWVRRTGGDRVGMWLLMGLCMLFSLVEARLLEWSLLAWMHLLCQVIFMNGFEERDNRFMHRLGIGIFLPISAGWALFEGSAPWTVGLFCFLACVLYGYGEASHQMLLTALHDSRESHRKLQRIQEQFVAQEKLSGLGMLAAGVAHEINNPMTFVTSNIRGLARDLAAQPQLSESLREYVEEVLPATLEGIRRVNAIVADLRRFARNDLEVPIEFDLNSEVSSALRRAQGELKDRCRVEVELGEVPPLVGRPRQLGQVVVNLLVNAVQALPAQGGVVKVRTRVAFDEVLVEVSDNGRGMPLEVQRYLFQPFFTTQPVGKGTGLGLAVAYGIVTGHGGRIDVDSAPGKGTRIIVRLPATAERMQAALATAQCSLMAARLTQ
jgi:two-component system NtrC family sensor kinase